MASPAARRRALMWAEEVEAREDVKDAYDALAPGASDVPAFFAAFQSRAMSILSEHAEPAMGYAREFAAIRLGGKVEEPDPKDVAAVVAVVSAEVKELLRHAQEILKLRARSMAAFGMAEEFIAEALLRDIRDGGRTGGQARSSVALAIGAGVNQLSQLAKHSAAARDGAA